MDISHISVIDISNAGDSTQKFILGPFQPPILTKSMLH
jgi:hypothetical protein